MQKSKSPIPGGRASAFPQLTKPMLMYARAHPFSEEGWLFELKLDGMRGLAHISKGTCQLLSKNGRERSATFPALAQALSGIPGNVVLDGEIVAHDSSGKPCFSNLEERWFLVKPHETARADIENPVCYYAFDILYYEGYDLRNSKLSERKKLLQSLRIDNSLIKTVEYFDDGESLFATCEQMGLEGIVAKKLDSHYIDGIRSRYWLKIKVWQEGVFTIIGYRKDDGFLLAYRDKEQKLQYGGSVFAGYGRVENDEFTSRLVPRETNPIERKMSNKETLWFEPTVNIKVRYQEQTERGILRSTVFLGFAD